MPICVHPLARFCRDIRAKLNGKNVAMLNIAKDTKGLYQRYAPKNAADDANDCLEFSHNAKYFEISSDVAQHTVPVTYQASKV